MIKILKNKNGSTYIYACSIILVTIIIFSYIFSTLVISSKLEKTKRYIQSEITSYLGEKSIEIYSTLKQGYSSIEYIKSYDFTIRAYQYLNIDDPHSSYEIFPSTYIKDIHITQDLSSSISIIFSCTCTIYENIFSIKVPYTTNINIKINYIPTIK